MTNGSNMDLTLIIETNDYRIMKRMTATEIEQTVSPKDILYDTYQEMKQSITKEIIGETK